MSYVIQVKGSTALLKVEGMYFAAEPGSRDIPGEPAYFEAHGVYIDGHEISRLLTDEVLIEIDQKCKKLAEAQIAECEINRFELVTQ